MGAEKNFERLRQALKNRNCTIEKYSSVMEITFHKSEDAEWFEDIFTDYERKSAVSCLMSMRPSGEHASHKFLFNIKDLNKFIQLLKEG